MLRSSRSLLLLAAASLGAALLAWIFWSAVERDRDAPVFGATFSVKYARELGLDWKDAYLAALDELGVRRLRLPVHWDLVEPERGRFDWSDVDWMMETAATRGAEVTLAIGRKTPRWPECHLPAWAVPLSEEDQRRETLALLEETVRRYVSSSALSAWQVENEPLFRFGTCPPPDRGFLKEEIALVRRLDADHPTIVTDSGELSTWLRSAGLADRLGISLYRRVWNPRLGELLWPVTPLFYSERLALIAPLAKDVFVSELQAEPWFRRPPFETPVEEQRTLFPVSHFEEQARFASRVGVSEIWLWGLEWWYWMRLHGDGAYWTAASRLY